MSKVAKKKPAKRKAKKKVVRKKPAKAEKAEAEEALEAESLPVKLNIGAGGTQLPGYTPVDRQSGQEAFPLDYPRESVDEIYASHILEHFPSALIPGVLENWASVLKPGGQIRIAVPDLDLMLEAYKIGSMRILPYLYGGHVDENDVHHIAFNRDSLHALMAGVGLERIRPFEPEFDDCSKLEISLNLLGYKPTYLEGGTIANVGATLAAPRFGPTMHFGCHHAALTPLKIPTTIIEGCYWWQQLSEGIEEHLEAGKEFVITMDYDSVFSTEQVIELYRLIRAYPEYDAICALQSKRGAEVSLFASVPEELGGKSKLTAFDIPVTHVMTGHFGLTIFRGDALREHPRPWMCPVPNEDGRWANGNIDADIDFWRLWAQEGRKLGLASHVAIGHMQQKITWPDQNFEQIDQDQQDYTDNGIPPNVRR